MPVHLFGRPAPLEELRALGLPIIEDAAQAFGAAGIATSIASTFSFFPTKNLFALGDGGLVAGQRRGARRAGPDAPLPRLAREEGLRAHRLQLAPRRDPGRDAAHLPAASRRAGTPPAARRRRATPSSGSASSPSCPADEPGHVYHMYCVRSPERDRLAAALAEARDRLRVVLPAAAASPAGAALPRLRRGRPAGDGEGRAREPLPAAVGGHHRGAAGRGRRACCGARRSLVQA